MEIRDKSDMAITDVTMSAPTPVVSVKPVVLSAPGRGEDLHVRVSAPVVGRELPLLVFSHGFGSSLDGYGPLVDFWAAHGFVVMQPTHLDSRTLSLPPDDPRTPLIWRFRVEDMKRILDQLDLLRQINLGMLRFWSIELAAEYYHTCCSAKSIVTTRPVLSSVLYSLHLKSFVVKHQTLSRLRRA